MTNKLLVRWKFYKKSGVGLAFLSQTVINNNLNGPCFWGVFIYYIEVWLLPDLCQFSICIDGSVVTIVGDYRKIIAECCKWWQSIINFCHWLSQTTMEINIVYIKLAIVYIPLDLSKVYWLMKHCVQYKHLIFNNYLPIFGYISLNNNELCTYIIFNATINGRSNYR
jgi:hypothetical protein